MFIFERFSNFLGKVEALTAEAFSLDLRIGGMGVYGCAEQFGHTNHI
jgi:hypothetical protein